MNHDLETEKRISTLEGKMDVLIAINVIALIFSLFA